MADTHSTLSNPAYHQLLVQLGQAKAHLDAAKRIADELVRDRMLVNEGAAITHALSDVACVELGVRMRARSTP